MPQQVQKQNEFIIALYQLLAPRRLKGYGDKIPSILNLGKD
jgi:hypothetical protein